ncbi:MAG: glycosyltransferase family 2 protein [bacterium]
MVLSIIIPHYNSVKSLKKLLVSIPMNRNIEILVIDDNSNRSLDELDALIKDDKFPYVKFFRNNSGRKGAGACRNIGIRESTGDWLLFADSDDFFVEDFYNKIEPFLLSENDIVFFEPYSTNLESGIESDRHVVYKNIILRYLEKKDKVAELKLRYEFLVPWSKLFRRQFILYNNLKFEEVLASNDVMFSVMAGNKMKKFEVTTDTIYCVTRNKNSLTVNISQEVFDSRVQVHIRYCQYLKSVLTNDELEELQLRGSGFLVNVIKYRLGFKKLISTYISFRKAKIKIFDTSYLNPIILFKKIVFHLALNKKNKKYYSK